MASNRKRWKYRDPSWFQIGWMYLLAIVFTIDATPPRILYALVFAVSVTVFAVIKVMRKSSHQANKNTE